MYLVLDASALLSGGFNSVPDGFDGCYVTPSVETEVRKGPPSRMLVALLSAGLRTRAPITLDAAVNASRSTGDLGSLSDADLSVIALAVELGDCLVITDDFRVQNVLKSLGIGFRPGGEIGDRTIEEVWTWRMRCTGCGRFFDRDRNLKDCPVCGSELRVKRVKG